MSTFRGEVKEIPFVAVDFFAEDHDPMPRMYFLTHFHTDHITGLSSCTFQDKLTTSDVQIYASPITVKVIGKWFPQIQGKLKEIEVDKCNIIDYKDFNGDEKHLQVTAIPAGHCPGSVMFFFEGEQNVLCTGDFRINPSDLKKMKIFHTPSWDLKTIDTIYLDSTFFNTEYEYFPSRDKSLKELHSLIKKLLDSGDNEVYLHIPSKFGPEFLIIELAKTLKQTIHIARNKLDLYKFIPDFDKLVSCTEGNYKIHTGPHNLCCPDRLSSKNNIPIQTIKISAQRWKYLKPSDEIVDHEYKTYYVCSSFHSSCSEIKEFLRYLKPNRVELCVVPENYDEHVAMKELLHTVMKEYKNKENKTKLIQHDSFDLTQFHTMESSNKSKMY